MGTSVRFGDEQKVCEEVYRAGRVGGREEGAVSRGAMDLSPGDKLDGSDIRLQRLAIQGDPYHQCLCVDNRVRGNQQQKLRSLKHYQPQYHHLREFGSVQSQPQFLRPATDRFVVDLTRQRRAVDHINI